MAKLLIVKGNGRGTAVDVGGGATIGRGAENSLQLLDERVSKEHARISREGERYVLHDLGSSNGTILNGLEIEESPLEPGDEIKLGDTVLAFDPGFDLKQAPNANRDVLMFSDSALGVTSVVRSSVSAAEHPRIDRLDDANRRLKAMYSIGRALTLTDDLPKLLDEILGLTIEALGQGDGVILLQKGENGDMVPAAVTVSAKEAEELTISRTIIDQCIEENKAILTADAKHDPRFSKSQSIVLHGLRSVMCVPLISRGNILGAIHIESSEGADSFQEEDLHLLVAIAGQAAVAIDNARQYLDLQEENKELRRRVKGDLTIIGDSPLLMDAFKIAQKAAATDVTILLTGETGTGKELFAAFIHENSPRSAKPFVCINCTTVTETLLESELFGHERGAFTGADKQKQGLFEVADGGTLFLDEIGDISPAVQMKLLRAVETKTFKRVGGTQTISVDVRVIAATSRNLEEAVANGQFRGDLFYRLSVVGIHLPPLRDRRGDIPVLIRHFLKKFRAKIARNVRSISSEAKEALKKYSWPGNIRELQNVIERAVVLCDGPEIGVDSLPSNVVSPSDALSLEGLATSEEPLADKLLKLEKICIERALKECRGRKVDAAGKLGISRPTLDKRIKQFNLDY
ncbi:MAG: FHA domain-containing protein [Planctomycetes bacterium]|nr:FHA domain-containing protein [Planctomycetota bacterium]